MIKFLAVASLVDAANCVYLRHDDWWFPTVLALVFTLLIRRRRTNA